MDPLPFLVLAVLVFWLIQLVAWMIDYYKRGQVPTGTNTVKAKQFIVEKIKKARKAKR